MLRNVFEDKILFCKRVCFGNLEGFQNIFAIRYALRSELRYPSCAVKFELGFLG
jgi:hypothetical protein